MTDATATAEPRRKRTPLGHLMYRLYDALPKGRMLPDPVWRRRHRIILSVLWVHAIGLPLFGWRTGYDLQNSILETSVVIAGALLAMLPWFSRHVRSLIASFGLVTASGIFVQFWGATTEANFHFFFVIGLLTLYQDWVPFLIAIGYVFLHHGFIGSQHPTYVYNHPQGWAHPWRWSAIYAGFIAAASVANIIAWRANEQLLHDPLTGLPSRLVLIDRLNTVLKDRGKGRIALMYVDLDGFKQINDTHGHAAGDEVLAEVARRMKKILRAGQTPARMGGDEFAILAPDIRDKSEAKSLATRISRAVSEPVRYRKKNLSVGASIGVTLVNRKVSGEEALRAVDAAMYRGKHGRKGGVIIQETGL